MTNDRFNLTPDQWLAARAAEFEHLLDTRNPDRIASRERLLRDSYLAILASECRQRPLDPAPLIALVCVYVGVEVADIARAATLRSRPYSRARALLSFLLHRRLGHSYSEIAAHIGCDSHSAVISAARRAHAQHAADLTAIDQLLRAGSVSDGHSPSVSALRSPLSAITGRAV